MSLKIFSLIFVILMFPIVSAEVFELPGCVGTATLGVNAYQPKELISDDCEKLTFRTYLCGCKNGTVSLFSKLDETEYDLIFDYEDAGVAKTKRFDNVVFKKTYANKFFTNLLGVTVLIFLGAIIVPLIAILIIHYLGGKHRKN